VAVASINFVIDERPRTAEAPRPLRATHILAEAFALWPDGAKVGVILWGAEGRLLGIELYELDPGLDRFPTVQVLRRWEDYFVEVPPGTG
jgi:hypothetical protein